VDGDYGDRMNQLYSP